MTGFRMILLLAICSLLAAGQVSGLESHGSAWLGIVVGDTESGTLVIAAIVPEGPAFMADLRAGDVLLSISGNAVPDWDRLKESVGALEAGRAVDVEIRRGGALISRSVTPLERSSRRVQVLQHPERDSAVARLEAEIRVLKERVRELEKALREAGNN